MPTSEFTGIDVDSAALYEVEEYLRSFGGLWQRIPDNLRVSIRDFCSNAPQFDEHIRNAVAQARLQSYEQAIREFARVCQRINEAVSSQM
jgi:hypothetical protein